MSTSSKTKSFTALEKKCLTTVNFLTSKCKLPPVSSIRDITSELIISIFESITNITIPDLLTSTNKVEEAHNVQAVIDTLSLDILGISLCHITGEDVVSGNLVSISNLLEVLHGLLFYSGSTTSGKSSEKPNLKRKICRKREIPTQKSSGNLKKISASDCTVTEVDQKNGKVCKTVHPLDSLLDDLQKKTPRRVSTRITQIQKENGKTSDSTSQDQSLKESPPAKVRKKNDEKRISPKQTKPATAIKTSSSKTTKSSLKLQQKGVKDKAKQSKETIKIEPCRESHLRRKVTTKEKNTIQNTKPITSNRLEKEKSFKPTSMRETVEDLHEKNLERKIKVIIDQNSYLTSRASHLKKWHFPCARKPVQSSFPACKKSFLLPHTLRPKPIRKQSLTKKSVAWIPVQNNNGKDEAGKSVPEFIKNINEDFPGLELPPSVGNLITKKYQQHLINMHRKAKDFLLRMPKTEVQAEEAAGKQTAISNILKKDMKHQQHMKELKENKENASKLKYHLRNSRMQSAKVKQYVREFQLEMRKKMLKRNYAEELIYEKVFEDALQIQKEQVDRLCKEYKEAGEIDARKQLIYLDALENLYQTQFSMMSEALASQKHEAQDQMKAEKQAMDIMHREFQDELKNEIRFMQQAIIECTEDIHFRELDAEECTEKLRDKMSLQINLI